jgi:hypothetical protein
MKNCLVHSAAAFYRVGKDKKQRLVAQAAAMFLLFSLVRVAAADPPPSAREILEAVRFQQKQQQLNLTGQIRENAVVVPFRLTQEGMTIRYSFTSPDESLQLKLGQDDSRLEEVTNNGVEKVTGADFSHKVRGTGITYEDLSLKFL